jgi:hypothetical protein
MSDPPDVSILRFYLPLCWEQKEGGIRLLIRRHIPHCEATPTLVYHSDIFPFVQEKESEAGDTHRPLGFSGNSNTPLRISEKRRPLPDHRPLRPLVQMKWGGQADASFWLSGRERFCISKGIERRPPQDSFSLPVRSHPFVLPLNFNR